MQTQSRILVRKNKKTAMAFCQGTLRNLNIRREGFSVNENCSSKRQRLALPCCPVLGLRCLEGV